MTDRVAEAAASALLAVQFLTRLPVPGGLYTPARMAASLRWYPAVGLLVGALAGLVFAGAVLVFPPLLAALLAVAAGILVTGAGARIVENQVIGVGQRRARDGVELRIPGADKIDDGHQTRRVRRLQHSRRATSALVVECIQLIQQHQIAQQEQPRPGFGKFKIAR